MIHFKKVNETNFNKIINLKVHREQRGYLEDNLYNLGEAAIYKHFQPRGIYLDDQLIGFLVYYFKKASTNFVYLHDYMIDKKFQGLGYGKRTLKKAITLFKKKFPSIAYVELVHYPDNPVGEALYEPLGFKKTGESRKSSPCRIESHSKNPNRYLEVVRRYYYSR